MTIQELYDMAEKFSVNIIILAEELKAKDQRSLAEWTALSAETVVSKIKFAKSADDAEKFICELCEAMNKVNESLYWIDIIYTAELIGTIRYELLKYKCNKIRIEISKAIKKAKEL